MNSTADSEDVLRVGGFYMLLDLTLTEDSCYAIFLFDYLMDSARNKKMELNVVV